VKAEPSEFDWRSVTTVPLALLPDQDMQQFTDHLLVAIGDALDRTSLT
jgi:hypothetical protein